MKQDESLDLKNFETEANQIEEKSILQIPHQKITKPWQAINSSHSNIVDYDITVTDKQTLNALKMFKSIFNEKEEWNLSSKKWVRLKLKLVFQNLVFALPKKIDLTSNHQPFLLNSLSHLSSFPCLKELKLSNNKISSIQKLTFLDFPALEHLILSDNQIASIKSLNKVPFKGQNIKRLDVDANRVQNLDFLSRVQFFKTKKFKRRISSGREEQKELRQNSQQEEKTKDHLNEQVGDDKLDSTSTYDGHRDSLSLLFGINQIANIEPINKLQRQLIEPAKKQSWKEKYGEGYKLNSNEFDLNYYRNNRRLCFSIEMNRQVLNSGFSFKRRNFLPQDQILM